MDGIFALVTFAISWMMCLFKNIANMQTCLFYYLLDKTVLSAGNGFIVGSVFSVLLWNFFGYHYVK
jgi:hypothetical protein